MRFFQYNIPIVWIFTVIHIADANMIDWTKSVVKVREKYKNVKIVIPGHGDWGNLDLLTHTIEILNNWNNNS